MEHTVYLSQVIGLFMIIAGASIVYRKQYFVPVIGAFVEERLSRMLMGILELLGGLFLVTAHTDFSSAPATIITIVGYVLVAEGTAYLLLSDRVMGWVIRTFNVRAWYAIGGCGAIIIGAYLCFFGFGLF